MAGVDTKEPLPIVVAGDVFDRWDTPVEFVNFVIGRLPNTTILAVSGQHDQPHHRLGDLHKSAYWTLVEAGRVNNLEPGVVFRHDGFMVWGFPWGVEPTPRKRDGSEFGYGVCLAVVHRYLWSEGHTYPDAPQDRHVDATAPLLAGFDAAVFGDNHQPFIWESGLHRPEVGTIMNHGAFIRRRADERHLTPAAGILWSDGTITTAPLDTSGDVWANNPGAAAELEPAGVDPGELIRLLETAADGSASFRDAAMRYIETNAVAPATAALVREWLEAKT